MRAFFIAPLFLIAAACGAPSGDATGAKTETPSAATLEIRDGWAAPTPGGVDVSAGYLTVVNATPAEDRLISASSPRATRVEVHEMTMDRGVMRMRPLEALVIPAGGEAVLAPGRQHLMFYGVSEPFAEGEEIAVSLTFEHAGTRDIVLPVRRATSHGH